MKGRRDPLWLNPSLHIGCTQNLSWNNTQKRLKEARPDRAGTRETDGRRATRPPKPACVTVSVTVAWTVGTRGVRTVASASRVQGGELLVPPDVRRETPLYKWRKSKVFVLVNDSLSNDKDQGSSEVSHLSSHALHARARERLALIVRDAARGQGSW